MNNRVRRWVLVVALAAALGAARASGPLSVIPLPASMVPGAGSFSLTADTVVVADAPSSATARQLAAYLQPATGLALPVVAAFPSRISSVIALAQDASLSRLGREGYRISVSPEAVRVSAFDQAGLFYGVQTLRQLLPPQIFSPQAVKGVDWQMPCVRIEDQPRFKWRGMMLDVSRHFFNKQEIKRILDLMAMHKLNTFHWHLVDRDGWRIEIKKYPSLISRGAWREGIGYGLDPKNSTAYGADGFYGGFYTQADIRDVVAYAKTRHIVIVPEIEMPGHSWAALNAYPELNCSKAEGAGRASNQGVYCAGSDQTFVFLQTVLKEIFELFPDKYIHIGGDEVGKDNWDHCPSCQARLRAEKLQNTQQLQSYFIRRIEQFINAQGRTLVGWSEIREGGLAPNAVMMDYKGGAVASATEGHDVVMSPWEYCYFDSYQSLDYSTEPMAIGCYLPLRKVYAFEPIPANLAPQYRSHILGGEAALWSEYIASAKYLDYMTFPRLCALAEAVWSPKEARDWNDFVRRLQTHFRRLDALDVSYRRDTAIQIGEWTPAQVTNQNMTLEWDATSILTKWDARQSILDDCFRPFGNGLTTEPGKCHVTFDYTGGKSLRIAWVALLENGKEIARDTHPGFAGAVVRDPVARDVVYDLSLPAGRQGARYSVQACVSASESGDSYGVVDLDATIRGRKP